MKLTSTFFGFLHRERKLRVLFYKANLLISPVIFQRALFSCKQLSKTHHPLPVQLHHPRRQAVPHPVKGKGISHLTIISVQSLPLLPDTLLQKLKHPPAFRRKNLRLMIKFQLFSILHMGLIPHSVHHSGNIFYHIKMIRPNSKLYLPSLPVPVMQGRNQLHSPCDLCLEKPRFFFCGTGTNKISHLPVCLLKIFPDLPAHKFRRAFFPCLPLFLLQKLQSRPNTVLAHSVIGIKSFTLTTVFQKIVCNPVINQFYMIRVVMASFHLGLGLNQTSLICRCKLMNQSPLIYLIPPRICWRACIFPNWF